MASRLQLLPRFSPPKSAAAKPLHKALPSSAARPGRQGSHVKADVAPNSLLAVPMEQGMQASGPVAPSASIQSWHGMGNCEARQCLQALLKSNIYIYIIHSAALPFGKQVNSGKACAFESCHQRHSLPRCSCPPCTASRKMCRCASGFTSRCTQHTKSH